MAVIAKLGFVEHGTVRTEAGTFAVRLSDDGWFRVGETGPEDSGRVRYPETSKVLEIERPGVRVEVHFHGETEKTTFGYSDPMFEVSTMDFGELPIREAGRQFVKSHSTVSGVRLMSVDPELTPIKRELAFSLALRSVGTVKVLWAEDVVYPMGQHWL